jgi:NAD(P)-dependent dehydrogenase (short-subunit alcohol dehydrogenase family)
MKIDDFAMDYFSLAGKNAIVTGGNSGLGQAFALALAKGGANVFVPSILDDDGSTKALVEAAGSQYEFVKADITETGMPNTVVRKCVERFGSVDILINSAGICPMAEVLEFGRDKWREPHRRV